MRWPVPPTFRRINPPFVPFSSSGNGSGGAFVLTLPMSPTPTPTPTPEGTPTASPTRTPTPHSNAYLNQDPIGHSNPHRHSHADQDAHKNPDPHAHPDAYTHSHAGWAFHGPRDGRVKPDLWRQRSPVRDGLYRLWLGTHPVSDGHLGSSGTFGVPPFTCPIGNPETYILATGGNAGSGTNLAIGQMAVLGPCNSLSSSITVMVNELTTVAAQWALAQFSDPTGQKIGTSSTNARGLANAVLQIRTDLVNSATGRPASFLLTRPVARAALRRVIATPWIDSIPWLTSWLHALRLRAVIASLHHPI